ncbi:DUF260 domain-containing protein, partial [Cephalotus follicularis]
LFTIMTIKGGTSQACAACKYQRRKCSKECPLAPYFPADEPKMFQNAHRLFGVRNIMNILKQVHDEQKEEAMRSIKYESNMRAMFPVHGCKGIISQLQYQLQQVIEELRHVHTQLAICKDQTQYQIPNPSTDCSPSSQYYPPSSQLQLGIATSNNGGPVYQQHHDGLPVYLNHFGMTAPLPSNDVLMNGNNGFYIESSDDIILKRGQQHAYTNSIGKHNAMTVQSQMYGAQGFPIQQEMDVSHDYDDIPFDAMADDRQSYIESKDACESRYVNNITIIISEYLTIIFDTCMFTTIIT